jgi:hypothetical protein
VTLEVILPLGLKPLAERFVDRLVALEGTEIVS